MKFLCDRCKTRYSIADERVRGKILKIRCKNCSAVISVREGMEEPADWKAPAATSAPAPVPAAAVRPPPASLHEEWYVSLDGNQEGPYLLPEAQAWVNARGPDDELHCWSEGFDDWLPVEKVSHFRGLRGKVTRARPATRPSLDATPPPTPDARKIAVPEPRKPGPEPKPLFAATLAALEADAARDAAEPAPLPAAPARPSPVAAAASVPRPAAAASVPRPAAAAVRPLTPLTGVPKLPAAAAARPPVAAADLAKSPAAVEPRVGTGALPPVQLIGAPTVPAARVALPPPRPVTPPSTAPVAARMAAPPSPAPAPPMLGPAPVARPAPAFDTGAGADGQGAPSGPRAGGSPPPAVRDPVDDIEDDLSIGEVSRVVRLSDIASQFPPRKPVAARNAAAAAAAIARGSGEVSSMDPAAAGAPAPTFGADPSQSVYQALVAAPGPRRRTLLYVGAATVVLAVAAVAVIVATSRGGAADDQVAGTTRSYDGLGGPVGVPLDRRRPGALVADAGVGTGTGTGRRPTGSGGRPTGGPTVDAGAARVENPVVGPDGQPLRPLSPDDVFAMSAKMEIGTRRCYERALKEDPFLKVTKIKATVTVKNTGLVSGVQMSSMQGTPLATCLSSAIGRWRFRPSTEGIVSEFALVFEQR